MQYLKRVLKPSEVGPLQVLKTDVNGKMLTTICDKHGNPVQLRGLSTNGWQWNDHDKIFNNNANFGQTDHLLPI